MMRMLLLVAVCHGTAAFSARGGRVLASGRPLAPLPARRWARPHLADRQSRWRDCANTRLGAQTKDGPEQAMGAGSGSQYWEWKNGWRIHFRAAGTDGPPLLLLTGFGVGGFHYARNFDELAQTHRVWSMDVLGQDQVVDFLEQVVKQGPVYIAGNSLGGYLAVMVASRRPALVKGLFLMNATPFWGVGIQRILPWTGGYPVPRWVRPLTITWWEAIRSPKTISSILSGVYASPSRVGGVLISEIIEPTLEPAAASAFASILCSPSSPRTFKDMLLDLRKAGTPVALAYGKEDPWIVPVWGFRFKRALPHARYWEISPAGHCPHHEAPEAINVLLREWVAATETRNSARLDALAPQTISSNPAFGQLVHQGKGFSIVECDGRL